MGPVRIAASGVASGRPLSLASGSGFLRLSRCGPLRYWTARPGRGVRAGLCPQHGAGICLAAVNSVSEMC